MRRHPYPDDTGQLQRHRRCRSVCRPDRRRQRRPVRHDSAGWRRRRTGTARCSRSPRPPPATPAPPPPWSASTAPTAHIPLGSLIADANGDLFGTTAVGGANGDGTVFEIAKTAAGYASTPTTLVSFRRPIAPTARSRGRPDRRRQRRPVRHDRSGWRSDTRRRHGVRDRQDRRRLRQHPHHPGQLQRHQRRDGRSRRPDRRRQRRPVRHDTIGGAALEAKRRHGTVFEIAKTASGYASTPTTLVSFNGSQRREPVRQPDRRRQRRPVRHDRRYGGANGDGTVFEIAKTATGYASTPTTLVSFNGHRWRDP